MPEVRQLWSFLDGAIMDVGVRHHLWRSWGLCSRHAWAQAVAEIELRGGLPFGVAILYEDLTDRAVHLLGWPLPWAVVRRRLRARDVCITCDYLRIATGMGMPGDDQLLDRLNRMEHTPALVAEVEPEWRARACPECLGGRGPVCRPHLLRSAVKRADREELVARLRDLRRRLRLFERSMTWRGPVVGPAERSSWLEVLGWFAGWTAAERLAARAHER